jgi:hypothetical protein
MQFAAYMAVWFISFCHILLVPFCIAVYMVVCCVCCCLVVWIVCCYCYVYVLLLLCMFRSVYSVSLCCSVYCLCVNVYLLFCNILHCTVLNCTEQYCTVLPPPDVNPIAVNKYIVSYKKYRIIYHIRSDTSYRMILHHVIYIISYHTICNISRIIHHIHA